MATDKPYSVENEHGYPYIYPLLDVLKVKDIIQPFLKRNSFRSTTKIGGLSDTDKDSYAWLSYCFIYSFS